MANRITAAEVKSLYPGAGVLGGSLHICGKENAMHPKATVERWGYLVDANNDGIDDYFVTTGPSNIAKYSVYEFKVPYGFSQGPGAAFHTFFCAS